MKNNVLAIAKKELARFFSNKTSALVSILFPGLLIFAMWSLFGSMAEDMFSEDEGEKAPIGVIALPQSIDSLAQSSGIELLVLDDLPDTMEMRKDIEEGKYRAVMVFPEQFDESVSLYDPASGQKAPQVEVYYDSTDNNSSATFTLLSSLLDGYESSLANRFDVNSEEKAYDVSDEKSRSAMFVVSIVPMLLLILLFTSSMSLAAESIAGEKERGTMATLLATPIKRSDIALGKIVALTLIGVLIAASSVIGMLAGLSSLTQGEIDINVYGVQEYVLLAGVILSIALVTVMIIAIVSALAKTTKEASLYLTPLMVVVVVVGLLGMVGNGAQSDFWFYLIPLYNGVQCMMGIFMFDFQPMNIVVCIVSNLVYTGIGVFVLQKMFNSERLMFAR